MHRARIAGCLGVVGLLLAAGPVGAQERVRALRVGNQNLAVLGAGHSSFDHANFSGDTFPTIAYQHRILRREMRIVPVWLRGAVNFVSEERRLEDTYTVWDEDDDAPFVERVDERTSDFTTRLEMLVDLVHTPRSAVYGGVGFAAHYVSFRSDGRTSAIPAFRRSENLLAPSLVGGARLFAARRPYTLYGEVRYGRAYGRTSDTGSKAWLTDQTFAFTSADAFSFEGGLGLHW